MEPTAHILPDGRRLHLQHGPIDLIIHVDGQRERAFKAAHDRFQTILEELSAELPDLRTPFRLDTPQPSGPVAQRMHHAAMPFSFTGFLTRMIAVAGAVADEILSAMRANAKIDRAYVNNGGDIALCLSGDSSFSTSMMDFQGRTLGKIQITARDGIGGIATSGRHGRSHSLGIADSVTVLAKSAGMADVAATLIANAVDLPGHPAIVRRPASSLSDDTDLGDLPVVSHCGELSEFDCQTALRPGLTRAEKFRDQKLIHSAALFLQGRSTLTSEQLFALKRNEVAYA